ncbi:unnamed protein product [Camellia sinensis]
MELHEMRKILYTEMAARNPGLIALFDVDGTLTAPRKFFRTINDYDYEFAENGLVAYKDEKLIGTQSLRSYLGEEKLKEFINFMLHYIADLDIPIKRFVKCKHELQLSIYEERDEFSLKIGTRLVACDMWMIFMKSTSLETDLTSYQP